MHVIGMFAYRFVYRPKKIKTEHDKKSKKRKHEYEEEEEEEDDNDEEVFMVGVFFGVYAFIFSMLEGSFLRSVLSCFRTSNPRRRRKTKM